MKVFFTCTSQQIEQYYKDYKRIRDYLVEKKQVITFDWLEDALKEKKSPHPKRNIKDIFAHLMKAINEADIVVAEATVANYSTAHQIFYAITRKKPILILWQKMDNEAFSDSYLDVFQSPSTWIEKYNDKNLESIISNFIKHFQKTSFGSRYNIVLDDFSRYYLDFASQQSGKSRSSIIREALKKMSQDDPKFA